MNVLKIFAENWLFALLYTLAYLGVFQMQRYLRTGLHGWGTEIVRIVFYICYLAIIAALVISVFKVVWYYPIIVFLLACVLKEVLYFILFRFILGGDDKPQGYMVMAIICTIILYIVLF